MTVKDDFPGMQNPDLVEELAHQIQAHVDGAAHALRRAADRIERIGAEGGRSLHDGGPAFSRIAQQVTAEVVWASAHTGLEMLISTCSQADVAARSSRVTWAAAQDPEAARPADPRPQPRPAAEH